MKCPKCGAKLPKSYEKRRRKVKLIRYLPCPKCGFSFKSS